jgi:hypothetical protein
MELSVWGFSGKRVGYILDLLVLGLAGFHGSLSCEGSGMLAEVAFLSVPIVVLLGFFTPRSEPKRFKPALLSVLICFVHGLFMH